MAKAETKAPEAPQQEGPAVIHAKGLEPHGRSMVTSEPGAHAEHHATRSMVTTKAPEPGAPVSRGEPVAKPAPPTGPSTLAPAKGKAPPRVDPRLGEE